MLPVPSPSCETVRTKVVPWKIKSDVENHFSNGPSKCHAGLQGQRLTFSLCDHPVSCSGQVVQIFFSCGPRHRHPHTLTSANLRISGFSHLIESEAVYSLVALDYTSGCSYSFPEKGSISFYLDQTYQCMQLFDFLLMIQAPKSLWSRPTKKQNSTCNQEPLTSASSYFFQNHSFHIVSFCLTALFLWDGCGVPASSGTSYPRSWGSGFTSSLEGFQRHSICSW